MSKFIAYASLTVVFLWLLFSYVPASFVTLPSIAFPDALNSSFQRILVVGAVLFVGLQVWVLVSTVGIFRAGRSSSTRAQAFHLSRGREFVWTALPILMTLLLAFAAHQTWSSLTLP